MKNEFFVSQKMNYILWPVSAVLILILCQWNHFLETKVGAAEENTAAK